MTRFCSNGRPGTEGREQRAALFRVPFGADGAGHAEIIAAAAPSRIYQRYRARVDRLLDPDGYPAIKPPWGTLSAIDLNTGKYRWEIPFGEYPQLADKTTGSENYGGPIVTAGGLLFIGATNFDRKFRAFDSSRQIQNSGAVYVRRIRVAAIGCPRPRPRPRPRGPLAAHRGA